MWRTFKIRRSPARFVFAIVLRAHRFLGWRTYVNDLGEGYLIPFFLGVLIVNGVDWRFIIILPLVVLTVITLSSLTSVKRTKRVFNEIDKLVRQNPHWRFIRVTNAEYLESLYRDTANQSSLTQRTEEDFVKSILPPSETLMGDYLRLVVVETGDNSALAVLSTFATGFRSWILLNGSPAKMNDFAHFKVLHEMGHTDPIIIAADSGSEGQFSRFLMSLVVIAFLMQWNLITLTLIAFCFCVLLTLSKFTMKWVRSKIIFIEELYADTFALARCPPQWFSRLSIADIEVFASTVCGDVSDSMRFSTRGFKRPLTSEQIARRREMLIESITRLVRGEDISLMDHLRWVGPLMRPTIVTIQYLLIASLLFGLGLNSFELTTNRFLAVTAILVTIVLIGFIVERIFITISDYWDAYFIPNDLSEAQQKDLKAFRRGLDWNEKISQWRFRRLEKSEQAKDKFVDRNFTPPGIVGRIFSADELDIHVNKATSEAYIYHSKVIDYDISHLEYYLRSQSIVVVMNDRTRLDLGVEMPWLLRPYLGRSKEVEIIRTTNREPVERIAVPLTIIK